MSASRPVLNPNVDEHWFKKTLKDQKISARQLSKLMKKHEGTVNRMFRGVQRISLEDAADLSRFLGVPIQEVLIHSGLDPNIVGSATGTLPVAGHIDATRRVHRAGTNGTGKLKGPRTVEAPPSTIAGMLALRYHTTGTPLDVLDSAVIYCRPLGDLTVDMMNRWCVVRVKGGEELVRVLRRGSRQGRFSLWSDEEETHRDVELEAAAVVEWMKF